MKLNSDMDYIDKKEEIKNIISAKIAEHQSNLEDVKKCIEESFHQSLGTIDIPYVERKYIIYCAKYWLEDTTNLLKELAKNKNRNVVQEIFSSLNNIGCLSEIPKPLNQSAYYKLLIKHHKLIDEEKEKSLVSQFKKECLIQIVAYSDSAEIEIVFLETFIDFLSSSKNRQSIIAELDLENFCNGKLSFDKLINNIMKLKIDTYGENVTVLQEATENLRKEDLFLINNFKEVIRPYIKPVEIQNNKVDGRFVIEVTGKIIVASEILQKLKIKLSENPDVEEMRFIGSETIHIDADLNDKDWHGKNIFILTKRIIIHNKVTWNISGMDSCHAYSDNAGTEEDGHGKQGKDGYSGESGGNFLILADQINNEESFIIVSNGGMGSKGQDGGNGKDGKDGVGITRAEFDSKFPSVVKLFALPKTRKELEAKTIENMEKNSSRIEKWKKDNFFTAYDIFVKTKTNQGNIITFSYYGTSQAFLLYEGSQGQPGGHGGEYGFGGQGGYAGEIIVKNLEGTNQGFGVIKSVNEGKEGENGKGGLYGRHGKNGWDMGYMDYQHWNDTKYFGRNQESKCTIEYYSNDDGRIWCPYKDKYAEITSRNIEHKAVKKYEERQSTRKNNDRQQHALAARKKNIPQSTILASYKQHLNSIERSVLQNLRSDLESFKQCALQAIIENQEQQVSQTTELRVIQHVQSTYQGKSKHFNDFIAVSLNTAERESINVNTMIEKLEKTSSLMFGNWSGIKNSELIMSLSQLDRLFSVYEALKGELQDMEKFLIKKYKIATLQEIAKKLPALRDVTENVGFTPENAARYLVEAKENDNDISHVILGTLNQYLYENNKKQRVQISKYIKEELQNTESEALKSSIRAFVLEVGKLEETHEGVKKYYNEQKEFQEKHEKSLSIFFEAFKSEISQPWHAEIFALWIESSKDESSISKLEEKIKKDVFLTKLYMRFYNQLKKEYAWDECFKDQAVLEDFNNYIQEKGTLSGSYRELLAHVFDINIRLYTENQDGKLFLQDDHNLTSEHTQIIHILCRDNIFKQLNIDENYFKLEEERKKKDDLYAKIFAEIERFKQKQEFDDYVKNEAFLSNNSLLLGEQSFNEEEDIKKIIEYFPESERQQLKMRLDKITSRYIGQHSILRYMLENFISEGRHVSFQELYCFISAILTSVVDDKRELNIFCWIIAVYPQKSWIVELMLLQLENYFKTPLKEISKWREYLSKIENKDIVLLFGVKLDQSRSISTQCVDDILYLLSNISSGTVSIGELELSEWPYALKEKYWICKLSKLVDWQNGDVSTASYYLLSIENIFGNDLAEKLMEALEKKKCLEKLSPDTLVEILSYFHNEKWNLSEKELELLSNYDILEWIKKMKQKFIADGEERDVTQLVELIKGSAHAKEISVSFIKIVDYIKSIDKYTISDKSVSSFIKKDITNWANKIKKKIDERNKNIEREMLAVIERAIVITKKIKLRDTQKLTILALLMNDRNTLAQVSTGEGKSFIVVAVSIMKALRGEKVHIITSSSVLAKRDADGNKDIYNLFGINVSHNCSEDIEKRKEAYSSNQVIYGDLSNFQRDYLLDRFYGRNILGDCKFDNVIVDEVDSLLLDKGNNMLYLSHDLACLDKLESVYIYIWQWINRPAKEVEEIAYALDIKAIKKAVTSDLYVLIEKQDIGKLSSELNEQQKDTIWEHLVNAGILDSEGKLLKENIEDYKLGEILTPEFNEYKDRLEYLMKEYTERERSIHVPNYLKPFIIQHLESWITSAISAFFMKAGQDYVVDIDRTGSSPDRSPNITILDRDTGTDQANSQWDEALHQFLQLKHGCKLSLQSLKAVFISNVSFFKLYSKLYGLTGTLGSTIERELLRKIHGVDFVTIPTAKSKQFHEDKPILCTGKQEWVNQIQGEVKKLTEKKKRSVLIICETVNDVDVLHKAFGGKYTKNVHTYTRDYEEFDEGFETVHGNKQFGQEQIIIATNLAGRGTDIKITEGLRKAGGLHVCLTYLPNNIRVEQQAFGRAARCGDWGSGQLIIMDSKGKQYSNSKILDLKKERDAEELYRISDIKAYYDTQIAVEESCFNKFKEQYERLKKNLVDDKVPTEINEILLQSCLDKWAFWLDKNNKNIKNLTNEQDKRKFNNLVHGFISQMKNLDTGYREKWYNKITNLIMKYDSKSWITWVEGNPVQMIKLGRHLSQNKEYENAIKLFDDVITMEPNFSEAAHYYKAFVLSKKIDWEKKPLDELQFDKFKKALKQTARLLEDHSKFSMVAGSIIGKIKKNNNESIIQIDSYEEQQKSLASLYYMYSRCIDDILGHLVTPQSFVNNDVHENLAQDLYKAFLEKGILKKPRIEKGILEKELKVISSGYGISVRELKVFLSKYEGKEFDEKTFIRALKETIKLPGREGLWKLLTQEKVLTEGVKYVIVDNQKLKEIDSSLLDVLTKNVNDGVLKKQSLEVKNEQILFSVECIAQEIKNDNVYTKGDFIKIIGTDKYKMLKKRRVLSFNRKAGVNINKIKTTVLSEYDSITIEDFTDKSNITKIEAKRILAELVDQGVLEKDPKNNCYRLKIKFDEIGHKVRLSFCSAYENSVKGLLSVCFTYREALQKITSQLEEKNSTACLQLTSKPHHSLIFELTKQQIIKPVIVARKDKKSIEKEVKEASKKLGLTNQDTIQNIISTLERLKSSLKALQVPEGKLKPFTELCSQGDFANSEETYVFSLNGLDHFLQLEEKRWTREMLINTAIVTAMGITQIAIGAVIELYSAGVMTHVGAAFISEGVSDLFFAVGALKSGHFSWEDYGQHKIQSLMTTVVTVGVGAYLSRGAEVSRIGRKLAAPGFEVGGKNVAQMTGNQLIKNAGWKVVGKEVTKRITLKAVEGISFGIANAGVDTLVENYLQGLCKGIASSILSNIEKEVENHEISKSLKEVYEKLGEKKARKMVNDLTKSAINEKNCLEKYLPMANKVVSGVTQGIAKAVEKRNMTSNKLAFPIHTISKVVVWQERVTHIAQATRITGKLLDDLDRKIKNKSNGNEFKKNVEQNQKQDETNFENFKKDFVDQWKSLLCDKAGRVISQHILSPILKEGSNKLVKYVGKTVQKVYQSYRENENFKCFENLKQKYHAEVQEGSEQQSGNKSQTENHITKKYHEDLLKLMKNTRNPELFAAIVRENIPMDLTCVSACTQVVHKILTEQGVDISGLTIIVEGDGDIRQKFSSAPNGVDGVIVKLELKNNHFQFGGSGASDNNMQGGSNNNCLFEALSQAIPELRNTMTPNGFRNSVASYIARDQDMQYHIRQGWHRLPISLGAVGGREEREFVDLAHDFESSSFDNEEYTNYEEYKSRERNVSQHFIDRFKRYFRLGGVVQRISNQTGIDRDKIVKGGASRYQDQRGKKIKGTEAGHVIRVGKINSSLKDKSPQLYKELKKFIGHTQIIPKRANEFHRIGGDVDKFQSNNKNLKKLESLNFEGSFTTDHAETIKSLKEDYINTIDKRINKENNTALKLELIKVKAELTDITSDSLFKMGKEGYSGENMHAYR